MSNKKLSWWILASIVIVVAGFIDLMYHNSSRLPSEAEKAAEVVAKYEVEKGYLSPDEAILGHFQSFSRRSYDGCMRPKIEGKSKFAAGIAWEELGEKACPAPHSLMGDAEFVRGRLFIAQKEGDE